MFMEGDCIWLIISPLKGVMSFGKKGKLNPRFISPFEILSWVDEVDGKIALSSSLSFVHPVFHIILLRYYVLDKCNVISFKSVELDINLNYEKEIVAILDKQVQKLRTKDITLVKVLWWHQLIGEAIWEYSLIWKLIILISLSSKYSFLLYA